MEKSILIGYEDRNRLLLFADIIAINTASYYRFVII